MCVRKGGLLCKQDAILELGMINAPVPTSHQLSCQVKNECQMGNLLTFLLKINNSVLFFAHF